MTKKSRFLLLGSIILLAFLLRFVMISHNPPSLYWDEVSQGNNAYLLLHTGYDEHHEFLPIARLIAYGDYKAPVYTYLIIPFMALLGKTVLAVRLPSVVFGTATVLITYFLVVELFFEDKKRYLYALLSALLLAISPWHIQLSRAAYEGNIATFFCVLGIYLFFLAKRKNPWVFVLCAISFAVTIYSFNAHRVFVPLMALFLGTLFYKDLLRHWKQLLVAGCIGFILLIPYLQFLRTPESKLRYQEVNIFSDASLVENANKAISQEGNSLVAKAMDNRRIVYGYTYLLHYLDFFNPQFLFINGDVNPRFSLQDNGELYLWELPLIFIGLFILAKRRDKISLFILGWILLAPVAGATARETPHALRGETFIPVYEILSGVGCITFYTMLSKYKRFIRYILPLSGLIALFSLFLFQYSYYRDYPYFYSGVWQDGYTQVLNKVHPLEKNYNKIIFTNTYGRAYAYVFFTSSMTPDYFWQNIHQTRDSFGLYNVESLGKYQFENTYQPQKGDDAGKILYVLTPAEIKPGMKVFDSVKIRDGETFFDLATY